MGRPARYTLADKTVVPSVTTILAILGFNKRQLMHWAWKMGMDGKDYKVVGGDAAMVGTKCHTAAESISRGLPVPDDLLAGLSHEQAEQVERGVGAFRSWLASTKVVILESEVSLVSEIFRYGGTMDAIVRLPDAPENEVQVLDFKTGALYPEHLLQLAGYSQLVEENRAGKIVTGYHLLRFGKEDGSFTHGSYPRHLEPWQMFKNARELYDLQKKIERLV